MNIQRPIAISLAPNLETKDVVAAFYGLWSFWSWKRGEATRTLEQWFRQYFKVTSAISFCSGRSALFAVLKGMNVQQGDEVLIQSFTCAAVVNAIVWTGAVPVYVDIRDDCTMDPQDCKDKVSAKTKAVLIQYTFGIPGDIDEIRKIAKQHKVQLIEDCAHVIGGMYKGKKMGTFGDAAIFSFGRDKAFSSVFGGMAITDNEALGQKIRLFQKQQAYPSITWTVQQLLHPLAFFIILPWYNFFSLGKGLLILLQRLHLLTFPVTYDEKLANPRALFVRKMPNVLCSLALLQLKRLQQFNGRREFLANKYSEAFKDIDGIQMPRVTKTPYLRFPILVDNAKDLVMFLRTKKIYVGTWYSHIIDPKGTDLKKMFYKEGMTPRAELLVKKVVNLPCYPTMSDNDIATVTKAVRQYVQH